VSADQPELSGPDLSQGIPFDSIPDGGMIGGHAAGQSVLVARAGDEIFAIGASCTHYGAPLAEGLVVEDTVRCPWHHACFSLRTGEAIRAPALNPVSVWKTERAGDLVKVVSETPAADGATPVEKRRPAAPQPASIVIIGAGGAGNAAAEMLRRNGYRGKVTMVGGDESVPYDRPNLSKDYLEGNAPEEWIPLRPPEFYEQHDIDLIRGVTVTAIDASRKTATLSNGDVKEFDRLLLATGSEPVKLPVPGADGPRVRYLRTLADSRSIIEAAKSSRNAVVIGSSFIGLEVAASLRTRGLAVDVVAPENLPLERVLGPELGAFVRKKHESKGVTFHPGRSATEITATHVTLDDSTTLPADLVVVGIGVRPVTSLAEKAGIAVENGVIVNEFMETSMPGVFAAGDIARFPDSRTGQSIRIEHWVVAERQGQAAARNMIGMREPYDSAPFFWSSHYHEAIRYVGHAPKWDEILIAGSVEAGDCLVGYRLGGKTLAVAAVGRDKESLQAEVAIERSDWKALDSLLEEKRRSP
jgi:NADPH-dependent 2,4-dienoyl-CoA reductase/sulfur reductase-like enzyme/nitrite reductase/ring-hydroxylating ferredoxin subunit